MKFLWVIACILAALDMMLVAIGEKPSTIFSPEWDWLAWFAAAGWLAAAFRAAQVRADWF